MKKRYARVHMKAAYIYAELSYAKRLIVKDDRIISIGFNGTPPGWDNCCENEEGKTKPEVIHAEANAIAKLAKTQGGGEGASVFITHAPCLECAKQLATMKVKEVYFGQHYRDEVGIDHLRRCKISVELLDIQEKEKQGEEKHDTGCEEYDRECGC
jgi:dCMP deaminase